MINRELKMDLNQVLVSIVVPVYNVQEFLGQCVDSLLLQTHPHIEIILVDDGSKDGSGNICDEYASRYSQVTVIHKENGGLSSARNAGIASARGEYIGFIDSDDWIEPTMFQKLLEACVVKNAQVATCAMFITTEEGQVVATRHEMQDMMEYSAKEAMEEVLSFGNIDVSFCDKLFRKELFADIEFPVGKINEDAAIIYRILSKTERIVNIGTPMYYYRHREGSISKSAYTHEKIQVLDHADQNEAFLLNKFPDLKAGCRRYKAYASCNVLCSMLKNPEAKQQFPEDYTRYMKELRSNILYLLTNRYVSLSWKLRGMLVFCGLYGILYRIKHH